MSKKNRREVDPRINVTRTSWRDFVWILVAMLCLTGGQGMIFSEYVGSNYVVPVEFILANVGYWALVTAVFVPLLSASRKRVYERPMRILSDATKRVAAGDFSVYLPPLRKDGKKDYIEVTFEDFNKMVEELGSTETMKNDFIANVSHEIKTPISIIQSYASALQNDELSPERRREYAETIAQASRRLGDLVSDILRLNKLENQEIDTAIETYDLSRQLGDCALGFESIWEKKGIEFSAELEDHVWTTADCGMMEIVWNNLISNALKFTEPGGTVALRQSSGAETITVVVSDSGCGMEAETMRHIFDKFYQGDRSHSSEGNGLGLALAQRIVERAGGSISVTSKPGAGSTFTVTLQKAAPKITEPL